MNEVQMAIEKITYFTKKFPAAEFQVICEHQEEAKPYLYKALDYVIEKAGDIEDRYELHFYALFLLAEFQDREAFERIIAMISIPPEKLDDILGDVITEGLKDILYHTYNGNLQLLKDYIRNPDNNEFARMMTLNVLGQLYQDGDLTEAELKEYLKKLIASDDDLSSEVYTGIAGMIYKCHFVDMLPELRFLFGNELIDRWVYGDYDTYVDGIFDYSRENRRFCREEVSIWKISKWAMFDRDEEEEEEKDFLEPAWTEKPVKAPKSTPAKSHKIGRNDPCPCGSGKKYKHCCLNKPKEGLDAIESNEDRKIRLKNYPETGVEKVEGRIYLEDFFDEESIEIDKLLYLGFRCQPAFTWHHRGSLDDSLVRKKRQYLWEGFLKYVDKMQKEGIQTNEEYDEKYSIHYQCWEWQNILLTLLQESEEDDKYQEVLKYSQK